MAITGKDGTIYLLNRDNLGHFELNANHVVQELDGAIGGLWGTPAFFQNQLYYGSTDDDITAFSIIPGNATTPALLSSSPTSFSSEFFAFPGPTPSISAAPDGSGAILWALDNTSYFNHGPAVLHAYSPSNLQDELYSSADEGTRDQAAGAVKFTVPTVANGKVYVGGEFALTIYGLLPASPSRPLPRA
jgi:hypothetical protein